MPAPEYVRVTFERTPQGLLKPRLVNGRLVPNWENGPELSVYFEQMRLNGWEFFSSAGKVYTFRRMVRPES